MNKQNKKPTPGLLVFNLIMIRVWVGVGVRFGVGVGIRNGSGQGSRSVSVSGLGLGQVQLGELVGVGVVSGLKSWLVQFSLGQVLLGYCSSSFVFHFQGSQVFVEVCAGVASPNQTPTILPTNILFYLTLTHY